MMCDRDRCWRTPSVAIPGLGQWCSAHVLVALGTWPTRRYRELESELKASRPSLLQGAA